LHPRRFEKGIPVQHQRPALGDVVAATFAEWDTSAAALLDRERAMYGTADPQEIARRVDAFCAAHLGVHIDAYLFYTSSQAGVSGVLLTDGRRIVVKAHTPAWSQTFLHAVHRVQDVLAGHAFPCPQPLLAPARLGHGYATVEAFVDDGDFADGHQLPVRQAMAAALVQLVRSTQRLSDTVGAQLGLVTQLPAGSLWPVPHSPIFDFEATALGAEWIDRIAAQARQTLARSAGGTVIGHSDWSTQNCRFLNGRLRVVYDWDSLRWDKETTIVAQAATVFPMNWRLPERPVAPSAEDARSFIAAYEAERGAPFTNAEWEGMAAAATYSLAYGARLEHSLDPDVTDFPVGSARARLTVYGNAFLQR
jgi:hypothetical protein